MDVSGQIRQPVKIDDLNLKEATGAPFGTDTGKWPLFSVIRYEMQLR